MVYVLRREKAFMILLEIGEALPSRERMVKSRCLGENSITTCCFWLEKETTFPLLDTQ